MVRTYKLLSDGRRQIDAFHLPGDIFGLEAGTEHRFNAEAVTEARLDVHRREPARWPATTAYSHGRLSPR